MRNRFRVLVVCLAVPVLALAAWALLHQREPSYRGKPLSAWMQDLGPPGTFSLNSWPLERVRQNAEAAEAIRQIGSAGLPLPPERSNEHGPRLEAAVDRGAARDVAQPNPHLCRPKG